MAARPPTAPAAPGQGACRVVAFIGQAHSRPPKNTHETLWRANQTRNLPKPELLTWAFIHIQTQSPTLQP